MDDSSSAHPPNHLLRAFSLGQLEAAEAEKVAEHLDACRDCSETMAGLQDDTFVSLVRNSPEALAGQQAEVQATMDSQSGVLGESAMLAELPPELLRHPRYEIVELIGQGGMGDVFKAQHKVMNRTVALKVIRPELVKNADAVDRFQREVQAAARLHHANIVTAHDAEQAGNLHFLVMEFVDGVDLSQVVQERGPLPVAEACDYVRQAAVGLEHARQLGMVHRDIKPHNLMLTVGQASSLPTEARGKQGACPTVKILDFGLANFASEVAAEGLGGDASAGTGGTIRSLQQLTQLGTMMGTPDYIAPEQAADARTADIRSDIYSLGCTLFFLLNAKPVFEGATVADKLKAHAEQPPPKLTDTRSNIPPELQQVVERMLAKNPAQRYQTPAEVANALADFVDRHRTDGGGRGRGSGDGLPATSDPMRFGQRLVAMTGVLTLIAALMAIGNRGWITFQYPEWLAPWLTIGGMVSLPFGVAAIITSLQMLRRRWYGFVMATVGLLLLPLNPAQIAMLPLTVWLLRHLRRPDIRAEFDADGLYPLPSYSAPPAAGRRLCLGLSALIGAGLLGVIIHFDTDHGDLTIELNDPSLTVRIERDGRVMRLLENGDTRVTFLPSGQYDITVPGAEDQVTITPNRVAIFRGAKKFVTILREPATMQQTDHDQIQGMWIAESGQRNGERTPLEKIDMQRMIFDGNKLHVEGPGGETGDGHFQLTETTSPKQIGVFVTADTRGLRGIYKLEGDRLTICLDKDQSADVPKTFAAPARSTLHLIVLRRAASVEPVADAAQGLPSGVVDQMLLQGLWIAVSGHAGGQPIPAEQLPKFSITIDQDQVTIAPAGNPSQVQRGTFKLNATSSPRRIDIVVGDNKEAMAGIYEVDQKRLKLALVDGDAARPTDFSPSDRPDHVTGVFERAPITGLSEYVEFKPAGLNGSFEVTEFGLPVNWSFYTPRTVPNGDFDIVMDKTDFKEGEQSLKFVVRRCEPTGGRLSPGFFIDFRIANFTPPGPFETRPGETYKISFWARNAGSEFVFKARGVSPLAGDKGAVIRSKETFNEWRRFECTYTIPSKPKMHLRLELNVVQPGTFWIDDLQVVKVSDKAPAPPDVSDEARLQGKWIPESCLYRGKPLTAEQVARMSVTFDGNRASMTDPDSGREMPGTFTIDASRTPKHIDLIAPDGKERMPGIFEFDGERLKMAWCDGDYARPTSFVPAQTPDHMTAVFKRVPGSVPTTVPRDELVAAPVLDETQKEVVKAAEAYLAVMDEGRFGALRDMVASMAKAHVTREQVSQTYQKLRDTFGKAERRTLQRVQLFDEFPSLPAGRYAAVQYRTDFERQKGLWESLLLNVDTDAQWRVNTYANTLEPMPFPETKKDPVIEQKKQAARTAAEDWLKLIDAGQYGEAWEACAELARKADSKEKMIDGYKELFQPLGTIKSRTFKSSEYTTQRPRAPVGEYAVIQFNTRFTNGRIVETVILMHESDGHWRVAGYRYAEDNSPPTPPPPTPPQRKTGLLTNPPKLPPEGVPVGCNLIVDPSLEETPIGELPQGWFAWLDDGPDFKCEVVEGGVTGKHCLQISGTGTRGVVFAHQYPA